MRKFERGILLKKDLIYSGKIVGLEVDQITINGLNTLREIVRHPGGVAVLAEVAPNRLAFVRQHRYPMNVDLLEVPAGKLDPGESPETSAARELEEETGYRARELTHVCSFFTSPGFCDELLHLFYTDKLEQSAVRTEVDEDLAIEFYTLEEALAMVSRGEIVDAKTITAIYWLDHHRRRSA